MDLDQAINVLGLYAQRLYLIRAVERNKMLLDGAMMQWLPKPVGGERILILLALFHRSPRDRH